MNWIRTLMVMLVILAIGMFVLSADITMATRGGMKRSSDGNAFCKSYCQAHHKEHSGMGSCIKWCKYNYFEPAR